MAPRFGLVAGEASGDLLAGLLLDGLRARWPGLQAVGVGGPQMAARGFQAWWPSDMLAVRGYAEVLRHYRKIVRMREQLKERLLQHKPEVFIGVDAPDFNLALEAGLKAQGIKTVHFVCPSVWAWRAERLQKMPGQVDHVLCIFPFEPALLARSGIASTYVGHPLASVIPMLPDRAAARAQLGLQPQAQVVALLPGSRSSEIHHLADRFFKAAALMQRALPELQFVLPAAPGLMQRLREAQQSHGTLKHLHILQGQSHTALAACDCTLVASGTATLEAALFKRPMVIAYHMHWLSWQLTQRKRLQPWVGLPNIIAGEALVPELLQEAATPQALADAVLRCLHDITAAPLQTAQLQQRFAQMHADLQRDTPTLASHAVAQVLAA
ncbi:MAG: lipid-A-disaccharide synthase [Burkholderiaceae bacterium]